jgi:hypothetical protein
MPKNPKYLNTYRYGGWVLGKEAGKEDKEIRGQVLPFCGILDFLI